MVVLGISFSILLLKMFIRKYPRYTTERYYLLSELGEIALFSTFDECTNMESRFIAIHFLGGPELQSLEEFVKKVNDCIQPFESVLETTVCTVQILIPFSTEEELIQSKEYEIVNKCFLDLKTKPFAGVFMGISNGKSSTVALECIFEWFIELRKLAHIRSTDIKIGQVIVPIQSDLLGFEDNGPDAQSDVFQMAWISHDPSEINKVANTVMNSTHGQSVIRQLSQEHTNRNQTVQKPQFELLQQLGMWVAILIIIVGLFINCFQIKFRFK
jgi:hypothetical protein